MKKFLPAAIAAALLSACGSDFTGWESRGPDSSTAASQKQLMLPPDFFLRAPVVKKDDATEKEQASAPESPELAADEAAEPTDVRSNTPEPGL